MRKLMKNAGVLVILVMGFSGVLHAQNYSTTIEMTNSARYQPAELVVRKGEKITWKNTSEQIQTITIKTEGNRDKHLAYYPNDAEPFSSGAVLPGESFSYTFFIPGTYEFVSLPNERNGMQGRITVTE